MKKTTLLFTALTVSAVSSVAMAAGWEDNMYSGDAFIGFEGGYAKPKVKVYGIPGESDDKNGAGYFGVRFGSYWNDNARAYLSLNYIEQEDAYLKKESGTVTEYKVHGVKQLNLLASADYLFMPESELRPFAGLSVGGTRTEARGYNVKDPSTGGNNVGSFEKKWSLSYGAQAGAIYQMDNFDLEAGVKFLTSGSSHHYDKDHDIKLKVNRSAQLYAAASIHF